MAIVDQINIGFNKAKDTLKDESSLRDIWDAINNFKGDSSALSSRIKKALITGRVYIQNKIADDTCIDDLLSTLQNIYIAMILVAAQLSNISDNKTVKKIMNTISTENLIPLLKHNSFEDVLNNEFSIITPTTPKIKNPIISLESQTQNDEDYTEEKNKKQDNKKIGVHADINKNYNGLSLSSGRIIDIKFNTAQGAETTVKFFVQLYPVIIPNEVSEQFIALNFIPSVKQRYLQMSVGEIKFWRDFVFQLDLAKERKKAMIKDKSGILAEMEKIKNEKMTEKLVDNAMSKVGSGTSLSGQKGNLANSVMIYDKNSFLSYLNKHGHKWSTPDSRQRFFEKTFTLMIALVDPAYSNVELYFNSIDNGVTYSYKQLSNSSKSDKYDLKDIMASFGQGMAPRF